MKLPPGEQIENYKDEIFFAAQARLQQIQMFYLIKVNEFPEVKAFVDEMKAL